jgi:hypothetical protein
LAEGILDDDIFLIPVRLEPCDLPDSQGHPARLQTLAKALFEEKVS